MVTGTRNSKELPAAAAAAAAAATAAATATAATAATAAVIEQSPLNKSSSKKRNLDRKNDSLQRKKLKLPGESEDPSSDEVPDDVLTNPTFHFGLSEVEHKHESEKSTERDALTNHANTAYSQSVEQGALQIYESFQRSEHEKNVELKGLVDTSLSIVLLKHLYPTIDKLMKNVYILYRAVNHVTADDVSFATKYHLTRRSHFALQLIQAPTQEQKQANRRKRKTKKNSSSPVQTNDKFKIMTQTDLCQRLRDHKVESTWSALSKALEVTFAKSKVTEKVRSRYSSNTFKYNTAVDYLRLFRRLVVWYVFHVAGPDPSVQYAPQPDDWDKEHIIFHFTTMESSGVFKNYTVAMHNFFRQFIAMTPLHDLKQLNSRESMNSFMLRIRKSIAGKDVLQADHEISFDIRDDDDPSVVTRVFDKHVMNDLWKSMHQQNALTVTKQKEEATTTPTSTDEDSDEESTDTSKLTTHKSTWSVASSIVLKGNIARGIEIHPDCFFSMFLSTLCDGDFLNVGGKLTFEYDEGYERVLPLLWQHRDAFKEQYYLQLTLPRHIGPEDDDVVSSGSMVFERRGRQGKNQKRGTININAATTFRTQTILFEMAFAEKKQLWDVDEDRFNKIMNASMKYLEVVGFEEVFKDPSSDCFEMDAYLSEIEGRSASLMKKQKEDCVNRNDNLVLYVDEPGDNTAINVVKDLKTKFKDDDTTSLYLPETSGILADVPLIMEQQHPHHVTRNVVVVSVKSAFEEMISDDGGEYLEDIATKILRSSADARMYIPLTAIVLETVVQLCLGSTDFDTYLLTDIQKHHILAKCSKLHSLTVDGVKETLAGFYMTDEEPALEDALAAYNNYYGSVMDDDPLGTHTGAKKFHWICLHHSTPGKEREGTDDSATLLTIKLTEPMKNNFQKKEPEKKDSSDAIDESSEEEPDPTYGTKTGTGKTKTQTKRFVFDPARRILNLKPVQVTELLNTDGNGQGEKGTILLKVNDDLFSMRCGKIFPRYKVGAHIVDSSDRKKNGKVKSIRLDKRTYVLEANYGRDTFNIHADNARLVVQKNQKFKQNGIVYTVTDHKTEGSKFVYVCKKSEGTDVNIDYTEDIVADGSPDSDHTFKEFDGMEF